MRVSPCHGAFIAVQCVGEALDESVQMGKRHSHGLLHGARGSADRIEVGEVERR
ncbi:hypothetical protein D3C87_2075960 [compost metagenome]